MNRYDRHLFHIFLMIGVPVVVLVAAALFAINHSLTLEDLGWLTGMAVIGCILGYISHSGGPPRPLITLPPPTPAPTQEGDPT